MKTRDIEILQGEEIMHRDGLDAVSPRAGFTALPSTGSPREAVYCWGYLDRVTLTLSMRYSKVDHVLRAEVSTIAGQGRKFIIDEYPVDRFYRSQFVRWRTELALSCALGEQRLFNRVAEYIEAAHRS